MSDSIQASTFLYVCAFGALLGAISMGLALGWSAPAFDNIDEIKPNPFWDESSKDSVKSLVGSMLAIGALAGSVIAEPSNKILGRRLSLIIFGVPFALGWLLIAIAPGLVMMIAGRFLTGLCCGTVSGIAPTYLVEIAPPKIRGMLGTCFQLGVVIGILLEAVLILAIDWRWLAGINIFIALGMSLLMLIAPETPQFLLNKNQVVEAESSLKMLRANAINQEFNDMVQSANANNQSGSGQYSLSTMTNVKFYWPLFLSLGLMFFQQFSGINAVLFYQTDIFKGASPDPKHQILEPKYATIAVCGAQLIATLTGNALVDRLGRRILLIASGTGHTLSLILFGFYEHLSKNDKEFQANFSWIAIVSLVAFISSFSIGFGPIPWMMIPEMTAPNVRSLIASIATCFNWICVCVVTSTVKGLFISVGHDNTYWGYAFICACSCLFVALMLPETKGKTTEQIQIELLGDNNNQQTTSSQGGRQFKDRDAQLNPPV